MIKYIVSEWLDDVKDDLVKNYDKLGLRASGNWERKLKPFQKVDSRSIKAGIKGERYTGALENGRKPTSTSRAGSPTLREAIRVWIDDKRIIPKGNITKDSLAYLIARKIHEKGINVPNKFNKGGLISDVVTKERMNKLNEQLTLFYINDFKSDVIKTLK